MKTCDLPITVEDAFIADFCRRHGIHRLSCFGSVTRQDFGERSDVDVLVEYLPGRHPGLLLFEQQEELAEHFDRAVDLHTPASLGVHFRDDVLSGAVPLYEQA